MSNRSHPGRTPASVPMAMLHKNLSNSAKIWMTPENRWIRLIGNSNAKKPLWPRLPLYWCWEKRPRRSGGNPRTNDPSLRPQAGCWINWRSHGAWSTTIYGLWWTSDQWTYFSAMEKSINTPWRSASLRHSPSTSQQADGWGAGGDRWHSNFRKISEPATQSDLTNGACHLTYST